MFGFFKRHLNKHSLLITDATIDDLSQLRDVSIATFKETYIDYIKTKSDSEIEAELEDIYNLEKLKEWIMNTNHHCLVVRTKSQPQKIVGYSLMVLETPQAKLSKIYLLRAYQGKGLGQVLLEANYDCLRANPEIESLSLEVWEKNQAAKKFYKRMGFRETGDKTVYSGSDPHNPFYDEVLVRDKVSFTITNS
ncbi:GNAT family N-acetyltransferase [Legionella israelensis]|uniref:Protease synthase and sporulation negative regulatory protein PAI 1 n=1 Tax=Legionella israelensis TaxID=454 RepID=A0A0W0VT63_9GAMM|nr:N-acetyltransferase [Legionella israelensis]KTD22838.1 Protease synthase and sporulation negative regulatory protein PAI 1 [Legionella israelensis]QBS09545.1 N-acetyltransferase [Legionella israelensis]SCY58409.1 Ribosomal protein S18 acetylase RimI [Legionella israelensis DSM 19235]STX60465.1 Protease synthase and sporulation negative regulatory protein PAI 1 [Legionella israelensis]